MNKIELLAPAGSFDSLIAAVTNGADAVYLGGSLFNARAYATNFDNEEMIKAVNYCHLHNVKIYVTINTLYYDEEFKSLIEYLDFLYSINVDALIIQDVGLLSIIKSNYPEFEIHISTQASVHQLAGVTLFEKRGVNRVVLARENTIEEIQYICQHTSIDIEVFVHGALCMGYSGQCLMSSLIGGRSGNRGKCAQPCRLPYILTKDDIALDDNPHYLLSAKDICTLENIGAYIDAGVTSFKIEGRMKRPEYVALVVKSYREAIDYYIKHHSNKNVKHEIQNIRQIFNRNLSKGHAFYEKQMITYHYPGNLGVEIGEVVNYHSRKKLVSIQLNKSVCQGDGIRFGYTELGRVINKMYVNDQLVRHGKENEIVEVEFNEFVKVGTKVFKTSSLELNQQINHEIQQHQFNDDIYMKLQGKINDNLILEITDGKHLVQIKSECKLEKAIHQALDHERIKTQLVKLGSTIYQAKKIEIDLPDEIQFPIKEINQLRREAVCKLDNIRIAHQRPTLHTSLKKPTLYTKKINEIHVHVTNLDQANAALKSNIDVLYVPFDLYEHLCLVSSKVQINPYVPRIINDKQLNDIKNSKLYPLINTIMISDHGALQTFNEKNKVINSSLNLLNSYSINDLMFEQSSIILSLELSKKQINEIATSHKTGIIVYGRNELMIANYCPISQHYFNEIRPGCNLCKHANYSLVDRKNQKFPIIMDQQCKMKLLNSKVLFVDRLEDVNVDFIVLKFTTESQDEVTKIVQDYIDNIQKNHKSMIKSQYDYTVGYYK